MFDTEAAPHQILVHTQGLWVFLLYPSICPHKLYALLVNVINQWIETVNQKNIHVANGAHKTETC